MCMHAHTHTGEWCDFICSVKLYPDFQLHGGSFLILILLLGPCTMRMWAALPTFWRYMLPPSSWLNWKGWVGVYIYIGFGPTDPWGKGRSCCPVQTNRDSGLPQSAFLPTFVWCKDPEVEIALNYTSLSSSQTVV
jgi:hypothetical protein